MALKIRLRPQGRTNTSVYRVVVTDSRYASDGKYVEALGWYNPLAATKEQELFLKPERIEHWLNVGAILSESAEHLVSRFSPEIVKKQTERVLALRAKNTAKRKARKQAKAK
jgi:small subunit ribosomal protein S16